jgi:hypothetical protein
MIAIKLQNNMSCDYICKHIQNLIKQYPINENDMNDTMLVIDIKKTYDAIEPVVGIEWKNIDLAS